jgi:hypothetical protein
MYFLKLVEYLKSTKTTQAAFAKKLGKSQTLISAYCAESLVPPRSTALKIVKVTKRAVTLADLWGITLS